MHCAYPRTTGSPVPSCHPRDSQALTGDLGAERAQRFVLVPGQACQRAHVVSAAVRGHAPVAHFPRDCDRLTYCKVCPWPFAGSAYRPRGLLAGQWAPRLVRQADSRAYGVIQGLQPVTIFNFLNMFVHFGGYSD